MLELNIAETVLPDLEEFLVYVDNANQKSRCNIVLFQGVGTKANLQHFFQVNETGRKKATTDVFLMIKMFLGYYSFE